MNRVVPLSAAGYSALACLRAEGPEIFDLVEAYFIPAGSRRWDRCQMGDLIFGHWKHRSGEEVVVSIIHKEAVEIHCHGGAISRDFIIDSLVSAGCRLVRWEEWVSKTATNEIEAAAKLSLSQARTHRVALILIDQLQGALRDEIHTILERLAQRDSQSAIRILKALSAKTDFGLHLDKGWSVTLIGAPNAGKSSLINAILGYQRSIVLSQPGTTRDLVTARTALQGWPIELSDTAGLRPGGEALEKAGMELALQQAARADLVLLVADASRDWTMQQDQWLSHFSNILVVHNKQDLVTQRRVVRPDGVETIATGAYGLDHLCRQIVRRTVGTPPASGVAVPFTAKQSEAIRGALQWLEADNIADAEQLLLWMLGRPAPKPRQHT